MHVLPGRAAPLNPFRQTRESPRAVPFWQTISIVRCSQPQKEPQPARYRSVRHGEHIMATMQDTSDTSGRLIAADKVEGTTVYNGAGENLGSVEDIMLDKMSGKACYAVLSFGGFLGMGTKQYPLPWE